MEFKIIEYGSKQYEQMVDLRHRILREPIGLMASEEELAEDKNYILLGVFYLNEGEIVGCCSLTYIDRQTVKLRQMAIDTYYQGRNLGRELVAYAERIARLRNYQYICLYARKTAIDFYRKLGYEIVGDEFIEVGIPHYKMKKNIE